VATGDGAAVAYRAGARVADMEFIQFHPTVLDVEHAPRFLLSEALRGEGARLLNSDGEAFMLNYHPLGDLAPRDVVARSIVRESQRTKGPVFLSMAHLDAAEVHRRFPMISATVLKAGFDLARDPIPVGPAAHYLMGGVETDLVGRTSIPGLFAAGEVACTRVHGANRLASNSLLEGLVFGARAGMAMAAGDYDPRLQTPVFRDVSTESDASAGRDASRAMNEADVRALMWKSVGLFRDGDGLRDAVNLLQAQEMMLEDTLKARPLMDHLEWRRASIVTTASLIARAALRRRESRGGHFRTDFPARDDRHWKTHITDVMLHS
jgi:L-aspartate oxidase